MRNATYAGALHGIDAGLLHSDDTMPKRLKLHALAAHVAAVLGALTEIAVAQDSQTVTHASPPDASVIRQNLATFSNVGAILRTGHPLLNDFQIGHFFNTRHGAISGTFAAFVNEGTIETFSNGGVIGVGVPPLVPEIGVYNSGTVGTLLNSGVIKGSETAIFNPSRMGSLVNKGAIGYADETAVGVSNTGMLEAFKNEANIFATATGVWNAGAIRTLENTSLIFGRDTGVGNAASASRNPNVLEQIDTLGAISALTNATAGRISGVANGVWNATRLGTLHNQGLIMGNIALSNERSGAIGRFINQGSLTGGAAGMKSAGLIDHLSNAGVMSGVDALVNDGAINTLSNSGSIKGSLVAVKNAGTITDFTNHGTIWSGANDAILNSGRIGRLENHGYIINGSTAISNEGARIDLISNHGVITAGEYGVCNANFDPNVNVDSVERLGVDRVDDASRIRHASVGGVNNRGLIAAPTAIYTDGSMGTINNAGVIMGNVVNLSEHDVRIAGGDGDVFGIFSGFSGENACLENDQSTASQPPVVSGLLRSPLANVHLVAGNTLLFDDVDLGGRRTLSVDAGVLQVTESLAVDGNYRQRAGATLTIAVHDIAVAAGSPNDIGYGQLLVTGIATIDAGAVISLRKAANYTFAPGQRFVVVDAATSTPNGITEYNAHALRYIMVNAAHVQAQGTSVVRVDGDGARTSLLVSLTDARAGIGLGAGEADAGAHAKPGAPKTEEAIAAVGARKGLGAYTGISDPALLDLYNASLAVGFRVGFTVDPISRAAAKQMEDKLSPLSQAIALSAAMSPTYDTMRVMGMRMDGLRLARGLVERTEVGASTDEVEPRQALWGQALGGYARQGQRDDVAAYSATFGGLMLGADGEISDRLHAGGVFTYSNMSIHHRANLSGNTTQVNGYGVFGYATYAAPKWYANAMAGAVYQRFKTTRQIDFTGFSGTASSGFGGGQLIARGEVGYPLAWSTATLTPLASLTYAYFRQNGYTESGGNGAALKVDAAHVTSIQSDLGAKIERAFTSPYGVLVPGVQVAWRHEYNHQRTSIAAQFAADPIRETRFTTRSATPVSDTAVLTAGLTLLRANDLSMTAQYTVRVGSGYVSQAGSVKLKQLF